VLVNAQVRDRGSRPAQDPVRGGGERVMGRRPGDPGVPGRLRRVIPQSVTSLAACSRSRPVIRHRGGTAGSHSVNVPRAQASAAHFHRRFTHRRSTVSCSREDTVPQSGHAAAALPVRDRPYLHRAARPCQHISYPQALHTEQRRRRILEHDAWYCRVPVFRRSGSL
jgi:hypothetical protein